jgi:hypothetical protein
MRHVRLARIAVAAAIARSLIGCTGSSEIPGGGAGADVGGASGGGGASNDGGGAAGQGGAATGGAGGTGNGGTSGAAGAGIGGGGASGSAGVGDAAADSRDAGTTVTGDGGVGGSSLCAMGRYLICENFESTAEGDVPAGFTKHGNASVTAGQAARGIHSLKMSAAASGERRIYTDAQKLGSGHWGRIFYRVELPVPTVFVHSTLVALYGMGPVHGDEEVRVVDTVKDATGKHQFLYNVQPSGAEFAKGSPYNWTFDGNWHCAEWHIDAPTQHYSFYYDGAEVTSITIDNGAGNYDGSDIPSVFTDLRIGWNNYQSAPPGFVAYIDEVALDVNRISCSN